ncbi:MAG: hypothetical protein WHX53_04500 [Anaerolineae bacterium]
MTANLSRLCSLAGPEVLNDLLDDDLLQLQEDERLWKLYCFRSAEGQRTQLRHRIYTKIKPNGRLALVTFAVHTPVAGRSVRSNIARVPDLPAEMLDRIIQAILAQAHIAPDGFELLDLSGFSTLAEQWDALGA